MTTQSFTTAYLQTLLGYPFRDKNWKNKFLIGSLVVLAGFAVPLVPFFFVYGYMMQIMRRIIVEKGEPYLPEWDDWGKLLVDGLKLLGVVFIYMLPVMVLFSIGYAMFFVLPFLGVPVMAIAGEENAEAAGGVFAVITVLGMVGFFILFGVGMLLALAIGLVMPAIMGHVVATDEFGAAFRFKEWWAVFRANVGGFLMAYVMIMLLSMVLSSAFTLLYCTIILCCLIPFLTAPVTMYLIAIYGALFGQAYRQGLENLVGQEAMAITTE
ncbi:MAG: DUF4013 domain-containing protein [Anaerolineae bacterium]|nr:DUF4013 domain-containing protein [Anaerolineae bacterium]